MGSASLLQTISILRSPHRHCRPRHLHDHLLLQWNPLLRFPQLRFPLAKLRSPTRLRLRCCAPRLPSAANREEKRSPLDVALGALMETLAKLKKPAAAIVLLGFLLAACPPAASLAASGGRMGGGTFSSSSSDSHCSSSSWSWPDPPGSSFSHSVPYYVPAPLGGELYVGPAIGIGCAVRSGFFLLTMGLVGVVMLSGLLSDWTDGSVVTASRNTSVIKLQVGLLGTAQSFQKDLDRIAEVADTSSSEGLSYILTEATLALLRHPDFWISAYSYVDVKHTIEDGEKCFSRLSIEERSKFDEETLVNVNNIRRKMIGNGSKSSSNEYIVVTILVAAEGSQNLPPINSSMDLEEALQKICSIPPRKTLAVEVLWTPQDENDKISERELLEDYPLLRPL